MIKFTGVNHLAMATGDMDKTITFWRDLLGMRMVAGVGQPGMRHYFFEISDDDLIAFFEWPKVKPLPGKNHGLPVEGPFIFDHVSFGVASENQLWELKDKLAAADIDVSQVIDHGFIHSIYAFDPNGIPIEFSWAVGRYNVRKNPKMVDTEPSAITLEGPDPVAGKWPEVTNPTSLDDRRIFQGAGHEILASENKFTPPE